MEAGLAPASKEEDVCLDVCLVLSRRILRRRKLNKRSGKLEKRSRNPRAEAGAEKNYCLSFINGFKKRKNSEGFRPHKSKPSGSMRLGHGDL